MLKKLKQNLTKYQPLSNSQIQKRASVLVPLLEDKSKPCGELSVLLTRRSAQLRSHAGQVSFPGGKQDAEDANPLETALREAHEEIELPPQKVEIIGRLDQILSLHYYLVTPFVGLIPTDFEAIPNPHEIESVFKVPLSFFMSGEHHWTEEWKTPRATVLAHHFEFGEYDIWGLTAKLILRLLEIGLEHTPDFPVHHPDFPTWMEMSRDYSGEEIPFDSKSLGHFEQRQVH